MVKRLRIFVGKGSSGFTLMELIMVVVIIGILTSVTSLNLSNVTAAAKTKTLSANLTMLQAAVDHFYALNSAYPTYVGRDVANQPVRGRYALPLSAEALDGDGRAFVDAYLRFGPSDDPSRYGIAASGKVYYGVTASGKVFATDAPPQDGKWTKEECEDARAFIQESVQKPDEASGTSPGFVNLSDLI